MTIAGAIHEALDAWKGQRDFDINDQIEWLREHLEHVFYDWADKNGYVLDKESGLWLEPPV